MGADAAPHDLFAERPTHRVGEPPPHNVALSRGSAEVAVGRHHPNHHGSLIGSSIAKEWALG